jgi:hypothetical protein
LTCLIALGRFDELVLELVADGLVEPRGGRVHPVHHVRCQRVPRAGHELDDVVQGPEVLRPEKDGLLELAPPAPRPILPAEAVEGGGDDDDGGVHCNGGIVTSLFLRYADKTSVDNARSIWNVLTRAT